MPSIIKTVSEMMKGMTAPQWILLVLFLIYFVFPVQFPSPIYQAFESIPGMIFVFCVIVYLFLYSHPVLGIFALLAAYEFFYYSTSSYSPATSKTAFLQYAPQPVTREIQPNELSPVLALPPPISIDVSESQIPIQSQQPQQTLEEEMVQNMAPVNPQDTSVYVNTRFQPVADSVGNASMYA
jgi:hypothetical protein